LITIQGSWKALAWIGFSQLCALSIWFSASVISKELIEAWSIGSNAESWLSAAVPIGFVIGALFSSIFGIADRYNPRKIFAFSALLGGVFWRFHFR